MSLLPIVTIPSPNLRERSREITETEILVFDTQQFIKNMIPAMYENDGIGLAAPQVDQNIRVCIIGALAINSDERPDTKIDRTQHKKDLVLINPQYQKISKKYTTESEGCLSVPGFYGEVKRYSELYVTALNEQGEKIEFTAKNFFARVIQHEIDHLNGILFIDRAVDLYATKDKKKLATDVVMDNIRRVS